MKPVLICIEDISIGYCLLKEAPHKRGKLEGRNPSIRSPVYWGAIYELFMASFIFHWCREVESLQRD